MTQWYVKELSKLTQVTVQTLHHYDRIGLLNPSVRLANGYRLYSEKDLLRLQQILALKFFGFELAQIKILLNSDVSMIEHFSAQARLLDEKAQSMVAASEALKNITAECSHDKSIPWETIIKLIEVYRMTQQLENKWVGKVLTPDELKAYANFEQEKKQRFSDNERQAFGVEWDAILQEVANNLSKDPMSALGREIGKRCMTWVNAYYGTDNVELRNAVWHGKNKQITTMPGDDEFMSTDCYIWLDKAISAYYRDRIFTTLSQVETATPATVLRQWEELLMDMCGKSKAARDEVVEAVMQEAGISQAAKNFVKTYSQKK